MEATAEVEIEDVAREAVDKPADWEEMARSLSKLCIPRNQINKHDPLERPLQSQHQYLKASELQLIA